MAGSPMDMAMQMGTGLSGAMDLAMQMGMDPMMGGMGMDPMMGGMGMDPLMGGMGMGGHLRVSHRVDVSDCAFASCRARIDLRPAITDSAESCALFPVGRV